MSPWSPTLPQPSTAISFVRIRSSTQACQKNLAAFFARCAKNFAARGPLELAAAIVTLKVNGRGAKQRMSWQSVCLSVVLPVCPFVPLCVCVEMDGLGRKPKHELARTLTAISPAEDKGHPRIFPHKLQRINLAGARAQGGAARRPGARPANRRRLSLVASGRKRTWGRG